MKTTKFYLKKELRENVLVFNTTNTLYSYLPYDIYNKYFIEKIYTPNDNYFLELKQKKFIFEDTYDEDFQQYLIRKGTTLKKESPSIWILPTTLCNAQCFYCYEKYDDDLRTMDEKTRKAVVNFILKDLKNKNSNHLDIEWYGGDPLVGHKVITKICEDLINEGIDICSRMVSNMGLMTREMCDTAKNIWKLERINTTIDAIGQEYCDIKNFREHKDGTFYFDKLVDNIFYLMKNEIMVEIKINFDPMHIERAIKVCDFVKKTFGINKYLRMYVTPIIDKGIRTVYEPFPEFEEHPYLTLFKKLVDCGCMHEAKQFFLEPKNINYYNPHPIDYVIAPDGSLYRFPRHISTGKHMAIGNIYDGIVVEKSLSGRNFIGLKPNEFLKNECKNCKILPSCQKEWKIDKPKCLKILPIAEDVMYLYVKQKETEDCLC